MTSHLNLWCNQYSIIEPLAFNGWHTWDLMEPKHLSLFKEGFKLSIDIRHDVWWIDICLYQRHPTCSESVLRYYALHWKTSPDTIKLDILPSLSVQFCLNTLNSYEAKQNITLHFKLNYLYLFWQQNIWIRDVGFGPLEQWWTCVKVFCWRRVVHSMEQKHTFLLFWHGENVFFTWFVTFFSC